MPTDTIIALQRLLCIREDDGTGHSEPYIWPAAVWIDDNTLATPDLVDVAAPALGSARVVIKNDMRAGETAEIPLTVGRLRRRLEDGMIIAELILVVTLWEEDETPENAMGAGFTSYVSELRAALKDNLLALSSANEEEAKAIIANIKTRVSDRVRSAITDGLTTFEKIQVLIGTLNLDDPVGSEIASFRNVLEMPSSSAITLTFQAGLSDAYEIQGDIQVQAVQVDRCQAELNAVKAAKSEVDNIEKAIQELKNQAAQASPSEREIIKAEIKRLREEELPLAQEAIEDARRALRACQN